VESDCGEELHRQDPKGEAKSSGTETLQRRPKRKVVRKGRGAGKIIQQRKAGGLTLIKGGS